MKQLSTISGHIPLIEFPYRPFVTPDQRSNFFFRLDTDEPANVTAINFEDEEWEHAFMEPMLLDRCPTWPEMVRMKELLWNPDDITIQVHPAAANYVNIRKCALHHWKLRSVDFDVSTVVETTQMLLKSSSTDYPHAFTSFANGTQFIAIYGGNKWPTWEEVCFWKKEFLGEDCPAVQYNISKELDLNDKYLLTVWEANRLPLPPKHLV